MTNPISKIKSYQYLLLIPVGVVFVLLSYFNIVSPFRSFFAYVFEPVSSSGYNIGNSISGWGSALLDASSYIEEHEMLRDELIQLKASTFSPIDQEEYSALKSSSSLLNSDSKSLMAKVLGESEDGVVYINVGSIDGVSEGDIVYVGGVFVGVCSEVDLNGSAVRLPTNRASSYEVVVLSQEYTVESPLDSYIKSKGVVAGTLEGIKIENIGINAEVSDGDLVVLRDERIGELLTLGRLVSLSKNLASTSKSGFVSPIFDYSNLITVFVRIK